MSILVTGGFGFIGSHVVQQLLEAGNQVQIIDNLSGPDWNLDDLIQDIGGPGLSYEIVSVGDYALRRARQGISELYHFASIAGPAAVLQYPGKIIPQMVNDSLAAATICERERARMILVSSSEIYGGGEQGLCKETTEKRVPGEVTPRMEYAVGKLAAEVMIINMVRAGELNASVVRPFNLIGPRQDGWGGFVVPRFVQQALAGKPLTVFGNGKQRRTFIAVRDAAKGIIAAMRYGRRAEAYNIGAPENRISILELARIVKRLTGSESEILKVDPQTIYPGYTEGIEKFANCNKAFMELRWKPEMGIEEAVSEVIDYERQRATAAEGGGDV